MGDQIKALWRLLLSLRKRDWDLDDYPLRVTDRGLVEPVGRLKPYRWTVQIVNWLHMRGDGDTLDAALAGLRQELERHRQEVGSLPRPGTGHALQLPFAPTEQVEAHYDTIADIVRRVFDMDPGDCFVSDESTLWNFHDGESNEEYHKKIAELYGVDVSDIEPPTLAAIAQRIDESGLTRG